MPVRSTVLCVVFSSTAPYCIPYLVSFLYLVVIAVPVSASDNASLANSISNVTLSLYVVVVCQESR